MEDADLWLANTELDDAADGCSHLRTIRIPVALHVERCNWLKPFAALHQQHHNGDIGGRSLKLSGVQRLQTTNSITGY